MIGGGSQDQGQQDREKVDCRERILEPRQEPGKIEVENGRAPPPGLPHTREQRQDGQDQAGDLAHGSSNQGLPLLIGDMAVEDLIVIPLSDPPAVDINKDHVEQKTGNGHTDGVKPFARDDPDELKVFHQDVDDQRDQDVDDVGKKNAASEAKGGGLAGIFYSSFKHSWPPGALMPALYHSRLQISKNDI